MLILFYIAVLVVDAGHDVVNVNTTIPFYFFRAVSGELDFLFTEIFSRSISADPQLELNYTYAEYSPGAKFPRDDSW
jgi:hypothetical protein